MSNTKNKISNLRDHLFAVIEALQDKDEPMDIERAKAVAAIAQVIVNSAKVEVQHMQVPHTHHISVVLDALASPGHALNRAACDLLA